MRGETKYERWKYTVDQKKWLQLCKISKQELYSMLEKIIDDKVSKVIMHEPHTTKYEVHTSTGFHCFLAFEKIHNDRNLVLLYETHLESYIFRWKPTLALELTFEKYDYNQNGVEDICFLHSSRETSYYMSSCVIGIEVEMGFTTCENIPFCKVINNYQGIFDVLTKYKTRQIPWRESMINQLLEIYKLILKEINNKIFKFNVERPWREYLRYEDGRMKMRAIINGENYVMCDEKSHLEWEENLIHHETFTCFNGRIYGFKREVTDEDYAQKILSGMEEGKQIYKKIAAELKRVNQQ